MTITIGNLIGQYLLHPTLGAEVITHIERAIRQRPPEITEEETNARNTRIETSRIAQAALESARSLNYSDEDIQLNNPHLII